MIKQHPIFYSFRRCPYAMRARLAIKVSGLEVELREVVLKDKPKEMLSCSAKGTVPVLQFDDNTVIDESRDIMIWALSINDPDHWLPETEAELTEAGRLIEKNDNEFKEHLDHYKYADRFPEKSMEYYRSKGELFLQELEEKLCHSQYLMNHKLSLLDIAVFPFIRQFAYVDKGWFEQSNYSKLNIWLDELINSELFELIMKKYPPWSHKNDEIILL